MHRDTMDGWKRGGWGAGRAAGRRRSVGRRTHSLAHARADARMHALAGGRARTHVDIRTGCARSLGVRSTTAEVRAAFAEANSEAVKAENERLKALVSQLEQQCKDESTVSLPALRAHAAQAACSCVL